MISLAARLSDLVIISHLCHGLALLCDLVSELRGEIIGWILHIHLTLGISTALNAALTHSQRLVGGT